MNAREQRPPRGVLPGEWDPPPIRLDPPRPPRCQPLLPHAAMLHGVLTDADCQRLVDAMDASGQAVPVSVSGHVDGDPACGSVRATAWAPALGHALWTRIRAGVPSERHMTDHTPTDWYALGDRRAHRRWRAVGVGPVLRFMRYATGGQHCAHYDMGFDYPDARRSLMSVVFYLTSTADDAGGRTRFVRDGQSSLAIWQRCHDDWARSVSDDEVILGVSPRRGSALIFDHRMCHDVERYTGEGQRIIIRGDIIFEALDD